MKKTGGKTEKLYPYKKKKKERKNLIKRANGAKNIYLHIKKRDEING